MCQGPCPQVLDRKLGFHLRGCSRPWEKDRVVSGAKDQLGELIWTLASRRHGSGSSAIRWQWDGGVHQGWLMAGTQALTCQSRSWRVNVLFPAVPPWGMGSGLRHPSLSLQFMSRSDTSAVLAPGCKFSAPSRKGSRHPGTRSFWGSSCQMAPTVCHRPRVFSHLRGPRSSHSLWSLSRTPLVEKAPNREPLTPLCFCDPENTAPCPSEPQRSWDGIEDANYPSPLGLL